MSATVIRADARTLPLPDASVDLIVTSPPYWSLRAYTDGGETYAGQIGAEPTPAEYLANLLDVTRECARVLKPSGSMFINLGDKYAQRPGQFGPQGATGARATRSQAATYADLARDRPDYPVAAKSLIGLPWRFAIGCVDELGLILRRDIVWEKVNGLPESVTDRCRSSHEYLFHLTKEPHYYAAVDEIREPHTGTSHAQNRASGGSSGNGVTHRSFGGDTRDYNPLGKLPGSVWDLVSEPLVGVPELSPLDGGPLPDHYAAFPTEIPRRCVLGWSPSGICVECGEGRRPIADVKRRVAGGVELPAAELRAAEGRQRRLGATSSLGKSPRVTVTGYACACPKPSAPTHPAVVLDPFGGTGTTALVASTLGRIGVSVDASHDYGRLAQWRTTDPGQRAKALGVPKPPVQTAGQADLFAEAAGGEAGT